MTINWKGITLSLSVAGSISLYATAYSEAETPSCFDRGIDSLQNLQCDQAIRYFTSSSLRAAQSKSISTKARRAQLFVMIGRAFVFDDNELAGAQAFLIADALNPNDQTTIAYLADALERSGQSEQAKPYITWLTNLKVKSVVVLEVLAQSRTRASDSLEAKSYLDQALKNPTNSKNAHLLAMKAKCLAKLGLTQQAGDFYARAGKACTSKYLSNLYTAASMLIANPNGDYDKYLRTAGTISPSDPMWHTGLAEYFISRNNTSQALAQHLQALYSPRLNARSFTTAAYFLAQQNRSEDAFHCLDYLCKIKPWQLDISYYRASIHAQKHDWKSTESELKTALALDTHNILAYRDLASGYISHARPQEARQVLLKAVNACPHDVMSWRQLGDLELISGNFKDAARDFHEVLKLTDANRKDYHVLIKHQIALAHAGLGTIAYESANTNAALQEARLLNQFKFLPQLPYYLSWLHLRPGRLEPGKTQIEREQINHVLLADMLRETKHLDQCIVELRKAIALNPDDIDLHSYAYEALTEKGDWLEAAKEDVTVSTEIVNKIPREVKKMTEKKQENP